MFLYGCSRWHIFLIQSWITFYFTGAWWRTFNANKVPYNLWLLAIIQKAWHNFLAQFMLYNHRSCRYSNIRGQDQIHYYVIILNSWIYWQQNVGTSHLWKPTDAFPRRNGNHTCTTFLAHGFISCNGELFKFFFHS